MGRLSSWIDLVSLDYSRGLWIHRKLAEDLGARSLLEKSRVVERFLAEEQQDLAYKSFPTTGLRSVRGQEKETYGESATITEISMAVRVERAKLIFKKRNPTSCQSSCHGPFKLHKMGCKIQNACKHFWDRLNILSSLKFKNDYSRVYNWSRI